MSFRSRLSLFFLLIVIIPMVAATVVVLALLSYSETSKADVRVAEGQATAIRLFRREVQRASRVAGVAGADVTLTRALVAGDQATASARARELLPALGARRLRVDRNGRRLVDVGPADATAVASRRLVGSSGRVVGRLQASVVRARQYAASVRRVTGLQAVVRRDGRTLTSTLRGVPTGELPRLGDLTVGGREYRVASFSTQGFGDSRLRVTVLSDKAATASDLSGARTVAAIALVGFLLLAFGFAIAVSRSLQAQIGRFLAGARRLATGDFSQEVPTQGRDEFAALGAEFNKMSRQLELRLEELRQERARLEDSIRRIGESFASNLDRDGVLELVVRTAVDAINADCGRASARDGAQAAFCQRASAGELGDFGDTIHAVETLAEQSGRPEQITRDGRSALAFPLGGGGEPILALVTAARAGRPFTDRERDLFNYLAGQAAVSLENVDLHEQVQKQAITDELTGLSNHRRFQELIAAEVERARRFGHTIGLVMLDIDDFKRVNDTYGHQQGDLVLREVGRVLRESSREIDEPARYGGEELAVALPETDLEGAYNLAERVREAIAELRVPRLGDPGEPLRVTASFGVAALPESLGGWSEHSSREDRTLLVHAADGALYRAKRAGKNRTERAESATAKAGRAE